MYFKQNEKKKLIKLMKKKKGDDNNVGYLSSNPTDINIQSLISLWKPFNLAKDWTLRKLNT